MVNIWNLIFGKKISLTSLTSEDIKRVLPKINYKLLNPAQHYLLDEDYESCSIIDFKDLLKKDFTNWKIYHKDYDCDNFAFKLYSNLKNKYPKLAVGIVFSDGHAFNVFVDNEGFAWYVEPQNDKIYSYSKLTKKYKSIYLIII